MPEDAGENHHVFEDDRYEQTIVNAVWHNKQMPRRRKNDLGYGGMLTRTRRPGANRMLDDDGKGSQISLDNAKS